jgi:hypothetical protein
MDDILFAKVNLAPLDKATAVKEILAVNKDLWFWDTYRATNMLPLMTKESLSGKDGASNDRLGEFQWLHYTPDVLKDWFEHYVFPWMGAKTRVMALMTVPKFSNFDHIDCNLNEIGTRQHKFRIVLQGRTDTLFFKTSAGNVSVPNIDGPFIMDGSWPHGMTNYTDDCKITIAAGAPWNGLPSYNNAEILMHKSQYAMPTNLNEFV